MRTSTICVPPPSINTKHRARDSIDPHHHAPAAIAITAYTLGFNTTTLHTIPISSTYPTLPPIWTPSTFTQHDTWTSRASIISSAHFTCTGRLFVLWQHSSAWETAAPADASDHGCPVGQWLMFTRLFRLTRYYMNCLQYESFPVLFASPPLVVHEPCFPRDPRMLPRLGSLVHVAVIALSIRNSSSAHFAHSNARGRVEARDSIFTF